MGLIRHELEYGWHNLPGHLGQALTKSLITVGETDESGYAAKIQFNQSSYEPGSYVELHKHEEAEEIFYVISGRGRAQIGDEQVTLEPGHFMWVPPKTAHGITNTGTEPLKFLIFAYPHDFSEWESRVITCGAPAVK
ncbi:cupin domain-containing protein [Rhodococcus opacus]|uniref:cupin domain-containing protein n=1 Tax=Rhodococcus opacus TaxID=37919 RepID=UPI001C44B713|nr:cupin domain-containing protein [Rhodococcus opacus]MBV6760253.1 cupin domain-containing protein [Rhodococcus opacus]